MCCVGIVWGVCWEHHHQNTINTTTRSTPCTTPGVSDELKRTKAPSPTCLGYTNHLLATATTKPFEVQVAAILPCFWIYEDVCSALKSRSKPENAYAAWVDMYGGESFAASKRRQQEMADTAFRSASLRVQQEMLHAFLVSTRFEYAFWDGAYELQEWAWPIDHLPAEHALH